MQALSGYIRKLRKDARLSQEKLAQQIGTTGNTIWRIETQSQTPDPELLFRIMDALGGSAEDAKILLYNKTATTQDGHDLAETRRKMKRVDLLHEQGKLGPVQDLQGFIAEVARISAIPNIADRAEALRNLPPEYQEAVLAVAGAFAAVVPAALLGSSISPRPESTPQ